MTVADLSERDLIARIRARLPAPPEWLLVGIGDDAAVVEPERNRVEVLTVDSVVEGVHFDRAFVPPAAIGHRALAVNLSDLAAMGAAPRLALLSLALPPALPIEEFDALIGGLAALASEYRLHVIGGNLTRSPGPLMIDVMAAGTVKRRQALTRAGARPGDELYVSGTIGAAAAGLLVLKNRMRIEDVEGMEDTEKQSTTVDTGDTEGGDSQKKGPSVSSVSSVVDISSVSSIVDRYLRPAPRVRLGVLLSRNRAATACMDLSDGLSDAVHQTCEASGVGAVIDVASLPIDPAARAVFASHGLDPLDAAIAGGDDYELLVAVRPRVRRRLAEAARRAGTPLTKIGVCTADRSVLLQRRDGEPQVAPLPRVGYTHFRSS